MGKMWRFGTLGLFFASSLAPGGIAGWTAAVGQQPTPLVREGVQRDAALEGAETLVGRALFLRVGYSGGELSFDSMGHVKGEPKQLDWTLAGVNIEKVSRKNAGELQLEGVRVAMRYNPEQHIFERHPLKDEKIRIMLGVNPDAHGLQGALAMMFAVGIDPALQRAMPPYWKHYFSSKLAWPDDDLTAQTIVSGNAAGLEYPVAEKKPEPEFTTQARLDHVKGMVQVKLVVGVDGVPRRIAIRQPLGYGLDARVVENLARYRFRPGMKDGKPVAVEMVVNQMFDVYPGPR